MYIETPVTAEIYLRCYSKIYVATTKQKPFTFSCISYHYTKTPFLPCKSMVFGVQNPLFYIAKSPFLACKKWFFAKPKLEGGFIVFVFGVDVAIQ